MQLTDAIRTQLQQQWDSVSISGAHQHELSAVCQKLVANRSRYEDVAQKTGVPWYFIACVHMRESSLDFKTYLGNGDPLGRKTVHVPAGRGPFASWEAGAEDALKLESLDKVSTWDIPSILWHFELYNGTGYRNKGIPSPYVWSLTNHYTAGKYVSDGHFDPSAVDHQPGCAAMLKVLSEIVTDLFQQVPKPPKEASMASTPLPIATAGVNVSTTTVATTFSSILTSFFITVGAPILAAVQGTQTSHYIAGALFGIAGFGSLVSNIWGFINHNSAASSNTLATISNLSAIAAQAASAIEPQQSPAS